MKSAYDYRPSLHRMYNPKGVDDKLDLTDQDLSSIKDKMQSKLGFTEIAKARATCEAIDGLLQYARNLVEQKLGLKHNPLFIRMCTINFKKLGLLKQPFFYSF